MASLECLGQAPCDASRVSHKANKTYRGAAASLRSLWALPLPR